MKKILSLISLFMLLAAPSFAAISHVVTVESCSDEGTATLRECMLYASTNEGTQINFNVTVEAYGVGYSTGPYSPGLVTNEGSSDKWYRIIVDGSQLPTIISNNTIINGTSEPWSAGIINTRGPQIEIRCCYADTGFSGFVITNAMTCEINGLAINGFTSTGGGPKQYAIKASNADNLKINRCWIGPSATGEGSVSQKNSSGIYIEDSNLPYIGSSLSGWKNVISGNSYDGIVLKNVTNGTVQKNYIGTDRTGSSAIANGDNGIYIYGSSSDIELVSNVVSGNIHHGIFVYYSTVVIGNSKKGGNKIGTDYQGLTSIPNGIHNGQNSTGCGVYLEGSQGSTVELNTISSNHLSGVEIVGGSSNTIIGNMIGVKSTGTSDALSTLGNGIYGINIHDSSSNNVIGGDRSGGNTNTISNNGKNYATNSTGIKIKQGTGNQILGNSIGTNTTGDADSNNSRQKYGIYLDAVSLSTIEGNIVSCNYGNDLYLAGLSGDSLDNHIINNYFGTNSSGEARFSGSGVVSIYYSNNNKIGGGGLANKNIFGSGLSITQGKTNEVYGNYFGVTASGEGKLGNPNCGIEIVYGKYNIIGSSETAGYNVISGNTNAGIYLDSAQYNKIYNNYIGVTSTEMAIPNIGYGIYINGYGGTDSNTIGGINANEGNVICANSLSGIYLLASSWDVIKGNYIGVLSDGMTPLANLNSGVLISSDASADAIYNTIGPSNIIANNGAAVTDYGVLITNPNNDTANVKYNRITQNSIYNNYGIGISVESTANDGISPPVITSANRNDATNTTVLSGTFVPGATVEVFLADLNGDGHTYEASGRALSASSAQISGLASGDVVTVTQTDANGNSSAFSNTKEVITTSFKNYGVSMYTSSLESNTDWTALTNKTGYSGNTLTFYFKTLNTGNTTEDAGVSAECISTAGSFEIIYYDSKSGGADITASITKEGIVVSNLLSGESVIKRIEVAYTGSVRATSEITLRGITTNDASSAKAVATFLPAASSIESFTLTATSFAVASASFDAVVSALDANGATTEVLTLTSLTVDVGSVSPETIAASEFSSGVWRGKMCLTKEGKRRVRILNGTVVSSADVVVYNPQRTYTNASIPGLSVKIPACAASTEITVVATSSAISPGTTPKGFILGSQVLNITAGTVTTFLQPVEITMTINSGTINPVIYYWTGSGWSSDGITVVLYTDTSITFTTTHFSKFAAFGLDNLMKFRFGPNPINPITQTGHFWYWLDASADITLYVFDVAGNVLYKTSYNSGSNGGATGQNNVTWDCKTSTGDVLGNGLYLFKVVKSGAVIGGGKIAVVK